MSQTSPDALALECRPSATVAEDILNLNRTTKSCARLDTRHVSYWSSLTSQRLSDVRRQVFFPGKPRLSTQSLKESASQVSQLSESNPEQFTGYEPNITRRPAPVRRQVFFPGSRRYASLGRRFQESGRSWYRGHSRGSGTSWRDCRCVTSPDSNN